MTEAGLVTFYDIRPGNGAGLFLQPRNCTGLLTHSLAITILSLNTLRQTVFFLQVHSFTEIGVCS